MVALLFEMLFRNSMLYVLFQSYLFTLKMAQVPKNKSRYWSKLQVVYKLIITVNIISHIWCREVQMSNEVSAPAAGSLVMNVL